MIQTNIKKMFETAGLENIRPTDEALQSMRISRRRFTLLLENSHRTPITLDEIEAIKTWIQDIKDLDTESIVGTINESAEIASDLGLSK